MAERNGYVVMTKDNYDWWVGIYNATMRDPKVSDESRHAMEIMQKTIIVEINKEEGR